MWPGKYCATINKDEPQKSSQWQWFVWLDTMDAIFFVFHCDPIPSRHTVHTAINQMRSKIATLNVCVYTQLYGSSSKSLFYFLRIQQFTHCIHFVRRAKNVISLCVRENLFTKIQVENYQSHFFSSFIITIISIRFVFISLFSLITSFNRFH